ncbi:hypothetical protein O9993_18620 [Vibrio lentus]|nr:hypothetical protein [Vibrio lentus]
MKAVTYHYLRWLESCLGKGSLRPTDDLVKGATGETLRCTVLQRSLEEAVTYEEITSMSSTFTALFCSLCGRC